MFAGIIIRSGSNSPQEYATADTLIQSLTPYNQADKIGHWENNKALIVHALTWNTAESKYEATPYQCPNSGLICASWLQLDNRTELCQSLHLEDNINLSDSMLVTAAYLFWGEECADRLEGAFSFLIYNPATQKSFCARDSIGKKPFFYYIDKQVFVFASTAAVFPMIRILAITLSEEWIAKYLLGVSSGNTQTAYENVFKLPQAHQMSISSQGVAKPIRYFAFNDYSEEIYERHDSWVNAYREKFHHSVETSLRSDYLIGAESSGGLDSSTIVSHAADRVWHSKEDFHCFGLCHMEDEPRYMLETAMYCGISKNHVITTPPYIRPNKITERTLLTVGYPIQNGLESLYYWFYEECEKHNIRTLLSGFGGDETVTSHASQLYNELAHHRKLKKLYSELPGNCVIRLLRASRLYQRHLFKQKSEKLISPGWIKKVLSNTLIKPEIIEKYDIVKQLEYATDKGRTGKSVNKKVCIGLHEPFWNGLMASRLENFQLMANSYRIDYRWPLLSRQLIRQYLSTPTIQKHSKGMGRYLHRQACAGSVPKSVLWKPNKDLGKITQTKFSPLTSSDMLNFSDLQPLLQKLISPDSLNKLMLSLHNHYTGEEELSSSEKHTCRKNLRKVKEVILFIEFFSHLQLKR